MTRLLPFLVLFACKGNDPASVPPSPTDGPTPTDVPTNPTNPGDCVVDPADALAELDIEEAHDRYVACLVTQPDDPELLFGKALTELVLMVDGPEFGALMDHCGETGPFGPRIYGPGGMLDRWQGNYTDHTFSLTAELVEDGTPTPLTILDGSTWAAANVYEYDDDGQPQVEIDIDIANDFSYDQQLSFDLFPHDVYQDGSNVALADGLVIDVANMWDRPWYYTRCNAPGSDCDNVTTQPSGTITVNTFGTDLGDTIDIDFDMHLPASCSSCSAATLHLVGSYVDTISSDEDITADVPFADDIESSACAQGSCDYRTEVISVIAELCPNATMDAAYEDGGELADVLRDLADGFDAAAAHADLGWTFPAEALVFFERDTPMNQTDAKLLAGGLRSAAAALDLGTGFTLIDPTATFGSLDGTYSNGDWNWEFETCDTVTYEGISIPTLRDQVEAHLGAHSDQADFAAARAELRAGLSTATAALDLQPTGQGWFDFGNTPGWTNAIRDDANVVIASLDGTDGSLVSAPVWEITLDNFFADVPSDADLRSETGISAIFFADLYQSCEQEIGVDEDAAIWVLEDNRGFPITEAKIDSGQVPLLFDPDGYAPIEGGDGYPRFFTPEIRSWFGQWD